MHKFATDQRRRATYIVAQEREYSVRVTYTFNMEGSIDVGRTYPQQQYWTLQKRIDPLLR